MLLRTEATVRSGRIPIKPSSNEATADLGYFTPQDDFGTVERGDPLPYQLPLAKRLEVGLERETWKLDVVPDPESNPQMGNPFSRAKGNALDFARRS